MILQDNLKHVASELPPGVTLVVVSKTQSAETIRTLYDAGHRCFGENKVQELLAKAPQLPGDIEWHFIGHLQRNKVKAVVPLVAMIHSIDSFRLLIEVNKEAGKLSRKVNCLLQFHIATEETKFGLDRHEAVEMLRSPEFRELQHVTICGVMGMASFSDNMELVRQEFRQLRSVFEQLKVEFFSHAVHFREISMGMSGDYPLAISEGSTMVRLGTVIFGGRH